MFYLTMHSTHCIYGYMASDRSRSSQCSTTGVTKVMVCAILSVGRKEMFYLMKYSTHCIYGAH